MRPELVTTAKWHAICFSMQVCILPKSTEAPLITQFCILWAALELTLIFSIPLACFPNTLREGTSQWMNRVFSTVLWFVYTLNSNLSQHLGTLVNSYHLMGLYFKRWSLLLDFSHLSLYRISECPFCFKQQGIISWLKGADWDGFFVCVFFFSSFLCLKSRFEIFLWACNICHVSCQQNCVTKHI